MVTRWLVYALFLPTVSMKRFVIILSLATLPVTAVIPTTVYAQVFGPVPNVVIGSLSEQPTQEGVFGPVLSIYSDASDIFGPVPTFQELYGS